MAGPAHCSLLLLLGCLVMMASSTFRGLRFAEKPDLVNSKMAGDGVVTYTDVSAATCAVRCSSNYPCGGFAYSAHDRVCTMCALCAHSTLLDTPGYRFYFITREDPLDSSYDEASTCSSDTSTAKKCWRPCPDAMDHVFVGPAGVWALNSSYHIFYREGTYHNPMSLGTTWTLIDGRLDQIDVGTDTLCGINWDDVAFYRHGISSSIPTGSGWFNISNNRTWISVSPGGSVWATSTAAQLVRLSGSAWQNMGMSAWQVDAGLAGVWVVNHTGHLFHRLGTYGDTGSAGTEWWALGGTFQSVSSGRDVVAAVDTSGHVWLRTGLSPHTPTGLAWLRYPGTMAQVEVYQTDQGLAFWGVSHSGHVFFSTIQG